MDHQVELRVNEIKKESYYIDFSEIINDSFNLLKNTLLYGLLGIILYFILNYIASYILLLLFGLSGYYNDWISIIQTETNPVVLQEKIIDIYTSPATIGIILISILINSLLYPILVGIMNLGYEYDKNGSVNVNDLFAGYKSNKFGRLIILYLICKIVVSISSAFFLLPGIYFWIALSLGAPFVMYADCKPIEAIKNSITVVNKHWFVFFGSLVILFIIGILGFIFCIVGILFTFPIFYLGYYVLYKYSVGFPTQSIEEIDKIGFE